MIRARPSDHIRVVPSRVLWANVPDWDARPSDGPATVRSERPKYHVPRALRPRSGPPAWDAHMATLASMGCGDTTQPTPPAPWGQRRTPLGPTAYRARAAPRDDTPVRGRCQRPAPSAARALGRQTTPLNASAAATAARHAVGAPATDQRRRLRLPTPLPSPRGPGRLRALRLGLGRIFKCAACSALQRLARTAARRASLRSHLARWGWHGWRQQRAHLRVAGLLGLRRWQRRRARTWLNAAIRIQRASRALALANRLALHRWRVRATTRQLPRSAQLDPRRALSRGLLAVVADARCRRMGALARAAGDARRGWRALSRWRQTRGPADAATTRATRHPGLRRALGLWRRASLAPGLQAWSLAGAGQRRLALARKRVLWRRWRSAPLVPRRVAEGLRRAYLAGALAAWAVAGPREHARRSFFSIAREVVARRTIHLAVVAWARAAADERRWSDALLARARPPPARLRARYVATRVLVAWRQHAVRTGLAVALLARLWHRALRRAMVHWQQRTVLGWQHRHLARSWRWWKAEVAVDAALPQGFRLAEVQLWRASSAG